MTTPNDILAWIQSGELEAIRAAAQADRQLLRTYVAEPAAWGEEMWFPLHHAAAQGRAEAVALLLELGVSPDSRTRFHTPLHARQTALHLAAQGGHCDVIRALLAAGAEVEVRDAEGASPLLLAAKAGQADAAGLLLEHAAMPDAVDGQGRTPLHWAVLYDDVEQALAVVKVLLASGCDVDAVCPKEASGYTALHRCVVLGDGAWPLASCLVDAGADLSLADPRFGRTAGALAAHLGHEAYGRLGAG